MTESISRIHDPRPEKKFRLLIEYDGTNYHGWQKQPEDSSIQGEIEKALEQITQNRIHLAGSGRTDAGVHAIGQVAHFTCRTLLSAEKFFDALNKMLPDDIVIRESIVVPEGFHARFSAKKKTYRYYIRNSSIPSALKRRYEWHIMKNLDISAMQKAASFLIGEKDFKAFEGVGSPRKSTIREIFRASIIRIEDVLVFEVTGSGFLKFMVRNIVGTLVDVGSGKITPDDFSRVLRGGDRTKAGPTAPPQGLFLIRVDY